MMNSESGGRPDTTSTGFTTEASAPNRVRAKKRIGGLKKPGSPLVRGSSLASRSSRRAKLLSATMVRTSGETADVSRTVAAPMECAQKPIRSGVNPRPLR